METVTIRFRDHFTMPPLCCACGAPSGVERLTVSGASRTTGRFVNYSFPLCHRCADISQHINHRRQFGRRVSLLTLLLLGSGAGIAYLFTSHASVYVCLSGLVFFLPLVVLGMRMGQWIGGFVGSTDADRRAFHHVLNAVRIQRFDDDPIAQQAYITFRFGNRHFAELFCQENPGVVMPGKLWGGESLPRRW